MMNSVGVKVANTMPWTGSTLKVKLMIRFSKINRSLLGEQSAEGIQEEE